MMDYEALAKRLEALHWATPESIEGQSAAAIRKLLALVREAECSTRDFILDATKFRAASPSHLAKGRALLGKLEDI